MSTASSACRFEEVERGVLVVAPRPELNEVQWSDIEQIGDGIVSRVGDRKDPRVVVDLSDLNFMGSAMVALVVRVWRTIEDRGGRMAVCNKSPMVLEVLELAGLTRKWNMVDSPERGIREVAGGGGFSGESGGGLMPAMIAWTGLAVALFGLYGVLTPGTLPLAAAALALCLGGLIAIGAAAFAFISGSTAAKALAAVAALAAAGGMIAGVLTLTGGDRPAPVVPADAGSLEDPTELEDPVDLEEPAAADDDAPNSERPENSEGPETTG